MSGENIMETLILSCATGGGHHAAAQAMREEMISRGHHVDVLDPYTLLGKEMDVKVGNCYVKCAQKLPKLFGAVYKIGNLYRRLPGKSPVYWVNKKTADCMQEYLAKHSYDVIFMTHIFPGEILAHLSKRGVTLPRIIYIATDYTCIPFTEEIECDYFVIPSLVQKQEFCAWGIPEEKVIPIGIPVEQGFRREMDRGKALELLALDPGKHYILMAGGSIGAGEIYEAICIVYEYLQEHKDVILIVVCGTNQKLHEKLENKYREDPQIILLKKTECMAEYLRACDFYISKPGGVSSTEAAVSNAPLIHISPIPGCETKNEIFFSEYGMSIGVLHLKTELLQAIHQLSDGEVIANMKKAQHAMIDASAAEKIAEFAEQIAV